MAENTNIQELQVKLEELCQGLGISVKEFVNNKYLDQINYKLDKEAILTRLDAIDKIDGEDNVETLVEKINVINEVLSNNEGELQGILALITNNSTKINQVEVNLNTEVSQRVSVVNDLQVQIDNLKGDTTGTVSELETKLDTEIETRISEDQRVLTEAKAYCDEQRIVASSLEVCPMVNIFRDVLDLSGTDCKFLVQDWKNKLRSDLDYQSLINASFFYLPFYEEKTTINENATVTITIEEKSFVFEKFEFWNNSGAAFSMLYYNNDHHSMYDLIKIDKTTGNVMFEDKVIGEFTGNLNNVSNKVDDHLYFNFKEDVKVEIKEISFTS